MATRTGSVTNIQNNNNTGTVAVTVPADAELAVVVVIGFNADTTMIQTPDNPPAINAVPMTQQQFNVDAGDGNQTVIYTLVNPTPGTQNFTWDWKGALSFTDGGQYNIAFYKGVDKANPVRAKSGGNQTPTTAGQVGPFSLSTGTLAMTKGDVVFGGAYHTPTAGAFSVTAPSGVSLVNDIAFNGSIATAFEGFPSAPSVVTVATSDTVTAWITFSVIVIATAPVVGGGRALLMTLNRIRPFAPPLRANPGLIFLSAAGQTVLLGTVTEIEAAIAFAKLKVKAMQLNSETDAALTLAQRKALTLAQATETDTNLAFGKFKVKALPVNTEADSAISLPGKKVKALTLATETDAAIAFTRFKSRILSIVSEVDAAIAFGKFKVKAFTLASETDTAVPFTRVKTRLLAVATEADSALAFTKKKVKALGVITETDLALAITRLISGQSAALATVLETDAVLAFVRLKRKALGQATEADTSVPLAGRKVKAVTLATEVDSTFAVGRQKARTLTPATTVTAALPFVLRKIKQITQVTESDSAIAIIRKVLSVVVNPRATFSGTGPSAGVVSTGSHATVVVDDAVTAEFSADPTANTVGDQ